MRAFFIYLYLITILNPYKGLDRTKINVYHFRKEKINLGISVIESDYTPSYEPTFEDRYYDEQKTNEHYSSDDVFIPYLFMSKQW